RRSMGRRADGDRERRVDEGRPVAGPRRAPSRDVCRLRAGRRAQGDVHGGAHRRELRQTDVRLRREQGVGVPGRLALEGRRARAGRRARLLDAGPKLTAMTVPAALSEEAVRVYRRYQIEIVEALNLCPWAERARLEGRVREVVSDFRSDDLAEPLR